MGALDEILATIRRLPLPDRLRLIERATLEVAEHTPTPAAVSERARTLSVDEFLAARLTPPPDAGPVRPARHGSRDRRRGERPWKRLIRTSSSDSWCATTRSSIDAELIFRLATAGSGVWLASVVLVEVVWVLRVAYKFDRATAAAWLRRLIDTEGVQVQDGPTTRLALAAFEAGAADFADYLILESARRDGALPLHTFDERLGGTRHRCPGYFAHPHVDVHDEEREDGPKPNVVHL